MQSGNLSKGIELLQDATELGSGTAEIHTQLAIGHLMAGEIDIAVAELKSAIDLDPELLRADILLVMTHIREKK